MNATTEEIYYTTDGTMPTISSTQFSGNITVTKDTVIKAITVDANQMYQKYMYCHISYKSKMQQHQDFTVVGVEFGNSFKQLCYLYPEWLHTRGMIRTSLVNPFDLGGSPMTPKGGSTGRTLPAFLAKERLDRPQSDSLAEKMLNTIVISAKDILSGFLHLSHTEL